MRPWRNRKPQAVATIKLTTNHLGKAKVGEKISCRATFNGVENEIAYVSGKILAGIEERIISTAIGTFMVARQLNPYGKNHECV